MNIQHQKIAIAITTALALGSFALTTAAVAQTAAPDQQQPTSTTPQTSTPSTATPTNGQAQPSSSTPQNSKTLQTVTVTGSLIRNVDVETAQPVTELTHEQIQQQGFVSVGQILQNV
ncbi:MAG TPA: hypothetical protein VK832_12170, partial [Burkholderiaceae bacterium]|nr:hypothetical protein [Burkholderiaceae bacterium]